ncbi:MAG: DUF5719 family protein [Actinomycetota bacterium]
MIAPSTPTDRSRVTRWPAIILLAAVISLMAIVDAGDDQPALGVGTLERPIVPTAGKSEALSSAWYCAAGTIVEDGFADHTLVIANPSAAEASVALTVHPVLAPQPLTIDLDAEDVAEELELVPPEAVDLGAVQTAVTIPPLSVQRIRVGDLDGVGGEHAAVLVESDVGPMVVEHMLSGSAGASLAPCASTSSSSWYFAAGTTRRGAREVISIFNPFPGDAVVDMTFTADGSARAPQIYEGLVVPSGTVLPVDITDVVTLFDVVSASLDVRTGRVVADRIVTLDGSEGLSGLSVAPGSSTPALRWVLPSSGPAGSVDAIAITNPSDVEADLDIEVRLDVPEFNGTVEPIGVAVREGKTVVVVLREGADLVGAASVVDASGRVLEDVGYWAVVRSLNGVEVIVERFTVGTVDEVATSASPALPVAATGHRFTSGDGGGAVVVVNPAGDRLVTVDISAIFEGARFDVTTIEVGQGARIVVDLEALGVPADALVALDSSDPVFVERRYRLGVAGEATTMSVPVAGTETIPDIPFG